MFGNWSHFDRRGAVGYLNRIPASHRDAAIQSILQRALNGGDIAFAERMYDRLASDESRKSAATNMYVFISRTDPKRAARYGELAGLQIDEDGRIRSR